MQTVAIVAGTILVLFLILMMVGMAIGGYFLYRAIRQLEAGNQALRSQSEKLTDSIKDLADKTSLQDIPRLVDGLMRLAADNVAQNKTTVQKIAELNSILGAPDADAVIGGSAANLEQANEEAEIENLMRNGITRDGAVARVKERSMWQNFRVD